MSYLKWLPVDPQESPKIPNWTPEFATQMRDHYEFRVENRVKGENAAAERGPSGKTEQHLHEERVMKKASSIYNVTFEFDKVKSEPGEQIVVCNKYLRENQDGADEDAGWKRYCRRESVYSLTHENYQTLIRRFARAREDRNSNFEAIRSRRSDRGVEERSRQQLPNERERQDRNSNFEANRPRRSETNVDRSRRQSPVDIAREDRSMKYEEIRPCRVERAVDNRSRRESPDVRAREDQNRSYESIRGYGGERALDNRSRRESPDVRARVDQNSSYDRIRGYGGERAVDNRIRRASPTDQLKSRDHGFNGYRDVTYNKNSRSQSRSPKRQSNSPKRPSRSPKRQSRSPRRQSRSPRRQPRSPRRHSRSPRRQSRSPARRYVNMN